MPHNPSTAAGATGSDPGSGRAGPSNALTLDSTSTESIVDRVYESLKAMAVSFQFKPGERLNEGDVARNLGVSRTPLREALNRLSIEGFLRLVPGKGYFCRDLNPKDIYDLYELRKTIEVASVRLAVGRASDASIDELLAFLDTTGPDPGDRKAEELVALDEEFHEQLMFMSGNGEMLRVLRNVNARIRFVRWIDMDRIHRGQTQLEHRSVLKHMKDRDMDGCSEVLEKHISRRIDEIVSAIKEGFAKIYL